MCLVIHTYIYRKTGQTKIPKSAVNKINMYTHFRNAPINKIPNALTVDKHTDHSQTNVNKEKKPYKKNKGKKEKIIKKKLIT